MDIAISSYQKERDLKQTARIWRESGWLENTEKDSLTKLGIFLDGCDVSVIRVYDEVQAAATTMRGSFRYLDRDLSLCAVTTINAGLAVRRRGISSRLTAHAIAQSAAAGAQIAALSFFDQGYYDRLGFGNGSPIRTISFDPAQLIVSERPPNPPHRINPDHWATTHRARLNHPLSHGACILESPQYTHSELLHPKHGFGLAYFEEEQMTHGFWGDLKSENGPYDIYWIIYRDLKELKQLLWLLKSFGEQIDLVRMTEPPGINLQDLLETPLRVQSSRERATRQISFDSKVSWQARILDIVACIESTPIPGRDSVRFNLQLTDPIVPFLNPQHRWQGVGGNYQVTIGPHPRCRSGSDPNWPILTASVNAFTRLWLGATTTQTLLLNGSLSGPPELLQQLSWTLALPKPHPNWVF